jgi:hypothetical protein
MKPRVFIGSSKEGLSIAYAIQHNLENDAEVTVWAQDVFRPSQFVLESLTDQLDNTDVGIFVFSADDVVKMRGAEHAAVRDNVLFEYGLYVGRLGRKRSFIVAPSGAALHLPSDLNGINYRTYQTDRSDGNWDAALGSASSKIIPHLKAIVKDDYGIKITFPKPDEEVPLVFTAKGTFEKLPPANLIKAIMFNEKSGEYWPKRDVLFDKYAKTWQTEVNNGSANTSGDNNRLLIIAAVDEHAEALFNYHRKAGKRKDAWVGIDYSDTIKDGVDIQGQVRIKLKNS